MDNDPWGEVDLHLEDEPADDEGQIQDLLALFAAADAREGGEEIPASYEDPAPMTMEEPEEPEPPEPIRSASGVLIAPADDLAVFNTGVFNDLMQIVSAFREEEIADLPLAEDVMGNPAEFAGLEAERQREAAVEDDYPAEAQGAEEDQTLADTGPEEEPVSRPPTSQLRTSEVQAQLINGKFAELGVEPLSTDEQQEVQSKLGQGEPTEEEIEAEVRAAPPTLQTPRPDFPEDSKGRGLELSTPSLSKQEPRLIFGDDMTEPPITPKMIEDLQRLQAKVQKEETEIFVSREGDDLPAEYGDPFGYPPPMKAKRTPFGDLVFYQCAACGEFGAMKVAIHTYRCYRCEAVIEYRPQRVE